MTKAIFYKVSYVKDNKLSATKWKNTSAIKKEMKNNCTFFPFFPFFCLVISHVTWDTIITTATWLLVLYFTCFFVWGKEHQRRGKNDHTIIENHTACHHPHFFILSLSRQINQTPPFSQWIKEPTRFPFYWPQSLAELSLSWNSNALFLLLNIIKSFFSPLSKFFMKEPTLTKKVFNFSLKRTKRYSEGHPPKRIFIAWTFA